MIIIAAKGAKLDLDNTIPPTLMARDQESLLGLRQKIWVNNKGLQVAADCPNAQEKEVHLWPITVESWLPSSENRKIDYLKQI